MIPTEREIRAMAFEICLHRGEHPNQTDNGGVEEWEKYKPLAVAVLDQAERLLALRAAPAGNELVERLQNIDDFTWFEMEANSNYIRDTVRDAISALSTIRLQALEEAAKVAREAAEDGARAFKGLTALNAAAYMEGRMRSLPSLIRALAQEKV